LVYRSWAEINLSNLEENLKNIHSFTKKDIFAVIKADAYGHGAIEIGRFLDKQKDVKYLCVATAQEGKDLRESKVKKPILVLGGILKEELELFNRYNLTPVISDFTHLELLKHLKPQKIHLKFDTGMHRLGFYYEDMPKILRYTKGIQIEGVMSHFPCADTNPNLTKNQIKNFREIINQLKNLTKQSFRYVHLQNTAGLIYQCDFCNSVRVGLGLYGTKPFEDFPIPIKQVMTVRAKIIASKSVKKGSSISYTGSFTAKKDMKIAVISFGYADGLPRSLSNKGYFLIRGNKAKIIGNITMDMTIVDISDISNINVGDEVLISGENLRFEILAKLADTIPYEIMCNISNRVFRKFLRKKKDETAVNFGSR